jgi:quercetin dioxygenase-like cupin family protein
MALEPERVLSPEVTEALADALRPAELAAGERDLMRARILNRVTAAPPEGTTTVRAHEGTWQDYAPGVQIKVLHQEPKLSSMTFLVRMAPDSVVPLHDHAQEEHCLVLEGEASMGEHILHAGDWHVALPGSTHHNFSSRTGCLLLIRAEVR